MKTICAALILVVLQAFSSRAEEVDPWNVRIEVQMVAVPEALALPLISELADEKKFAVTYNKIQQWLLQGKVKLVGWPIITTKSGNRAVIESINEYRFATEFGEPTVTFTPNVSPTAPVDTKPKFDMSVFAASPTSFETRNIGVTFEVEPMLSPDTTMIELNLVPQHVRLKKLNKFTVENESSGAKVVVEQPEFDTMKVTTSLTLRNGQRTLLGVFRMHEPANHLEFFFLKAEARKVE